MSLDKILKTGAVLTAFAAPALAQDEQSIRLLDSNPGEGYTLRISDPQDFYLQNNPLPRIAQEIGIDEGECKVLYAPFFELDESQGPYLLTPDLNDPDPNIGGRVTFVVGRDNRFYQRRVPEENLAEFRFGDCPRVYQLASNDTN